MNIKNNDDYEWDFQYPQYHAFQTKEIENSGLSFEINKFDIIDNILMITDNLHPNQHLLYQYIFNIKPTSVFEVGFGYCNHLISIKRILPNIECYGVDISSNQYYGAMKRYKDEIKNFKLFVDDFLLFDTKQKFDVVYSNAVIMHMSTNRQMEAIKKMFYISNKYVILLDGGLVIPDLENFIKDNCPNSTINFMHEWAKNNWNSNNTCPIIITKVDTNENK